MEIQIFYTILDPLHLILKENVLISIGVKIKFNFILLVHKFEYFVRNCHVKFCILITNKLPSSFFIELVII